MRGQRKNPRKAVQPFENKKRKIDIFKNYEANGVEKIQRKLEIFSTLISKKSTIDYQNYPVTDEATVRAFIQVYLAGAGLDSKVERHNSHGRSDLEVKVGARLWVFELKTAHEEKSSDAALQERKF